MVRWVTSTRKNAPPQGGQDIIIVMGSHLEQEEPK